MYSKIELHADIPLPTPQVHAKHPLKHAENHEILRQYVTDRLGLGAANRDSRLPRMVRADKSVAGWMKKDEEDSERQAKQDETGIPQALTVNLPLNFVQLDDMMTYYSQTFSPNRGMFYQMGKPDEVTPASQIVSLMNNHAIYAGYFRHVLMAIFSNLKYNLGGFEANWAQDTGPRLGKGVNGEDVVDSTTIWQGNRVTALDMYNTFWDPTVHPTEVYRDGEWCAKTEIKSHHWVQRKCAEGLYFNCEEALEADSGIPICRYYRSPPAETHINDDEVTAGNFNWVSWLSAGPSYASASGFELTTMYIKLNPWQLNLIPRTKGNIKRQRLEIWRITILNDSTIIDTTPMTNIHGYLPFFMGSLNDDLSGAHQKSAAEIIMPLQDFASFLLNTHVRATRKNIWGLTIYDKTVVDLAKIPAGEVSARVPALPTGTGKNISQAIWESSKTLDTKQTMQDLGSVMDIIGQFFPTTSLPSQIASIDRAVDSQVAAVQQGANRRMQKGARLLDDTMFRPLRFCLYYNIIQFQPDGVQVSDFYGKPVTINLAQLRETDLPFIIGQGLKALDRQAAASAMQQVIFALIQNPNSAARVDVLALIDYWTSMLDIDIDMKQFELQAPPQPGVVQPGAEGAVAQEGVVPATNPQAVTEPLRG